MRWLWWLWRLWFRSFAFWGTGWLLGHDTHREREPLGTCILDFAFLFEAAGIFLCAVAGGLRDLDTTDRFQ